MENDSDNIRKSFTFLLDSIKSATSKSGLRFNVSSVGVSWIARQYFCEKQVELYMKHGEVENERIKMGKEFHENIHIGMEEVKLEKVLNDILSGRSVYVSEMPLAAKWKGVPIVGRVDLLLFSNSKPLWLFEFKFTDSSIPPDSSHVQARIYSLLLKLMGFDVSMLKYAIVLTKDRPEEFGVWRDSILNEVQEHISTKEKVVIKIDKCRVFIRKPNLDKAEEELNFALGYWLNKREAIPTKKPSKCESCVYSKYCDSKPVPN